GTPARAAASPWRGAAHAAARLVTAAEATGSARHLAAGIEIRVAPGWHTYWRSPGDAGVAPRIDWRGSQNLARATLAWPAPRRFSLMGLDTIGYDGDVVLPVQVTLTRPGQPARLRAALDYAVCAEICVPYHAALALALPAGPARTGPEAPLIARFAARVPKPAAADIALRRAVFDDSGGRLELRLVLAGTGPPFAGPDLFVEGAAGVSFGRPAVELADHGREADLRVPVSGAKLADLLGKPLTLTVVDGRRAAEFSATPTAEASAAHYR
ncbi:MAG TPA: protein-disulfide reductase DsbD domain-containing protein, partial [Stellaceae bacterium]|nr:protein-disulfide reductase DsbD domain-containing protein [Stellaceae bacterium]